jgi:hypothetical protein
MALELMMCSECGAEFDEDLFAGDPTASFICPLCGTLALDARPLEDRVLHLHAFAAPPPRLDERLVA